MEPLGAIIIVLLVICLIMLTGIRVAQEYQRCVVFRLGRVVGTRGPGMFYLLPIIERGQTIDIRTVTVSVEQQETITKDSVTIKVNAVLWFKVVDAVKATVHVEDYEAAVYQIALTSLRNVIGQHMLDEILKERDKINVQLRSLVDGSTLAWGVDIVMVEMKDVEIPIGMQRAMAQEAEAIREKRARIIKAEAEQEASIKLQKASEIISQNPYALELRRMQMITEVGAEQNTTTIIMMPSEFVSGAKQLYENLKTKPNE